MLGPGEGLKKHKNKPKTKNKERDRQPKPPQMSVHQENFFKKPVISGSTDISCCTEYFIFGEILESVIMVETDYCCNRWASQDKKS